MSKIPDYYYTEEWKRLRSRVLARDEYICQYCGGTAYQADHVIPRSRGGKDSMENLVASCSECNAIAGGSLFRNFKSKKNYINKKRRDKKGLRALFRWRH